MELKQGTELQGGKYVIKRVLGQGGFGITYLAEQVLLGRDVAVKEFFMKDSCLRDEATGAVSVPSTGSAKQVEQYRKKFLKEAQTLARLDHPHIVSVIDVLQENGTVYYIMPFMSGGSLKDLVRNNGPLSEADALRYIRQIADALKYMHDEKRVCHYDVKPANILLDNKGNAMLIDFGISKNYDSEGNETSSTPVGMSEGYAPIEQYQQLVNEFSPASDVYALGATLYYLVMGKTPPSAISRISGEELAFTPDVSSTMQQLIEKAMIIGIKQRPSDAGIFNNTVESVPDTTIPAQPTPPPPPVKPSAPVAPKVDKTKLDGAIEEKTFTVNGVYFTMVRVNGGTFMMGEVDDRGSTLCIDAKPVHEVMITKDYYIGEVEVTQELWRAVMRRNPSKFKGDQYCPVENVSWDDCQRFIERLNELTEGHFRLPTEAEWEFAARGGNYSRNYKYAGGDNIDEVAWYDENSGVETWYGKAKQSTHSVGSKQPNELGLYDMSGNVWEWCQDWMGSYDDKPISDPTGPISGVNRVIRGGCWNDVSQNCSISFRNYLLPNATIDILGMRLAMDAD